MPAYRSRTTTHGRNMAGARALWRATGMKDGDFDKPIIAIANSFTQFVPGHVHLKDLGQLVAREIEKAGGVAKEFNTIAVDDGIAMGHGGMLYSLPSRDLIADSVELVTRGHCLDGVVVLVGCDKTIPAAAMALARLDIPGLVVYGGSIMPGRHKGIPITIQDVFQAVGAHAAGTIDDAELTAVEREALPGPGACGGQFTANTMALAMTALGLSPMGLNDIPAVHPDKPGAVFDAGRRAVELVREGVSARRMISAESLRIAATVTTATAGSTNSVLHLLAMAHARVGEDTLLIIDPSDLSKKYAKKIIKGDIQLPTDN